jgi:ATP-dependent Zn protease
VGAAAPRLLLVDDPDGQGRRDHQQVRIRGAPASLTVEPANAMDTVAARTRGTGERAVAPLGMCGAGL